MPWRYDRRVVAEDSVVSPSMPEAGGARVRARWRLTASGDTAGDVLARVGGEPWLVRHGPVVLLGSRLVPEETSLPLSGTFVPFLGALLNRAARGEAGVRTAIVGESVVLPPGVSALEVDGIRTPVTSDAAVVAPDAPGVHPLLAGVDTVGMLVVGPDPRESELIRGAPALLATAVPGARTSVTDDPRRYAAERFRGAGRSELTGLVLAAALALLVVESLLAAGGTRRSR
jgi:hypothetical protein